MTQGKVVFSFQFPSLHQRTPSDDEITISISRSIRTFAYSISNRCPQSSTYLNLIIWIPQTTSQSPPYINLIIWIPQTTTEFSTTRFHYLNPDIGRISTTHIISVLSTRQEIKCYHADDKNPDNNTNNNTDCTDRQSISIFLNGCSTCSCFIMSSGIFELEKCTFSGRASCIIRSANNAGHKDRES
jgi:hypothetical protein